MSVKGKGEKGGKKAGGNKVEIRCQSKRFDIVGHPERDRIAEDGLRGQARVACGALVGLDVPAGSPIPSCSFCRAG